MDRYLKCDLHMHSSSCYSRKYSEKDFINHMKNIDLDVFSITDHNVIDVSLYQKLEEELGNKKQLIGGIELNISLDVETITKNNLIISGEYFHAVIWFSTIDLSIMWNQIKSLIIDLGIDVQNKTIRQVSSETKGLSFSLVDVQDKLKDINYYLTFHEGKSARNLSDYLPNCDEKTKENILSNQEFKHNLFYYNNKFAIEGGKKTKNISNFFEENLNVLVTRFLFSDALKLEDIGKKFTWVNFDGKFESLMLPLSDPETRVFTSDEYSVNPQKNRTKYLEKVKLFMVDSKSGEEVIKILNFTPSYNGIIGSRGSGKTLLGSVLANKNVNNYNKYINHTKTEYKISGKSFQNNTPNNKYLAQNSLLDIFRNGEAKNIDFIKDFYKVLETSKKEVISLFTKKAKILLDYEQKEFLNLYTKYQGTINDITFLEASVNEDYMIPVISKNVFRNGEECIEAFKKQITEVYNDNLLLLGKVKKISEVEKEYTELDDFNLIISQFKNNIIDFLTKITKEIENTKTKVDKYDRGLVLLRNTLIKLYIESLNKENETTDEPSQSFLFDKEKALEQLKEYAQFRAKSNKIHELISEGLSELKIETKSEDIIINDSDKLVISTTIEDLKDYNMYLSDELKNYNEDKHNEIIFDMLLNFNELATLRNFFNGSKYRQSKLTTNVEYIEKYYTNISSSIQKFDQFTIRLYFNEKDLEEYSPGKKSEILLDIFLDKSLLEQEYLYIVLDQPEDNMDTKTITKKLITRLRELKKEIQIFVISHSAAVIINGDAENLVYAYEDDAKLSYEEGRIIDQKMKKNIVDTLDGGEKNLKMRLNKYDFKLSEVKK